MPNPEYSGIVLINHGFAKGEQLEDLSGNYLGKINKAYKYYVETKDGKRFHLKKQNITWRKRGEKEKHILVIKKQNMKICFPKAQLNFKKYLETSLECLKRDTGYEFKDSSKLYEQYFQVENEVYIVVHIHGLYMLRRNYCQEKSSFWLKESSFLRLKNINMGVRYFRNIIS